MTTRPSKTNINPALRRAIFQSGKTQRALSIETAIPEVRLSLIKTGRVSPTDDEKDILAFVLKRTRRTLFPPTAQDDAVQA